MTVLASTFLSIDSTSDPSDPSYLSCRQSEVARQVLGSSALPSPLAQIGGSATLAPTSEPRTEKQHQQQPVDVVSPVTQPMLHACCSVNVQPILRELPSCIDTRSSVAHRGLSPTLAPPPNSAHPYAIQPAPIQDKHPAQPLGKPRRVKMHMLGSDLTPQKANPDTEQSSNKVSEEFGVSPISLLNLPSDLDLDLDISSLQPEISHPFDAHGLQAGMDHADIPSHYPGLPFAPEQSQICMGRSEQEHRGELPSVFPSTSQGSQMFPSSASTLLPSYLETASNHPRRRSTFGRNTNPKSPDCQSQDKSDAHLIAFDQQEQGTALITESKNSGPDPSHGQLGFRRPRSLPCGVQGSYSRGQQITKPLVDPVLASWILKLSNFRVELHLHMLSIPPVEVESITWTDSNGKKPNPTQHDQEIAVDSTIQFSDQYTDILQDILSRFKTRQADTGPTTAVGALDQPSQLLILSSYLCLAESYDKILQHINTWTEIRSKMGGSTSTEHFPFQLPSLAIGSFKLSTSSSSRPLVLTCIVEAMIMQIRDLVSEMTKPTCSRHGSAKVSNSAAGEQGNSSGDGLSGVAKVTLQAIRAKEDSIMKLIHRVCQLALSCGGP
ncbi:MAG: hypothetical protein Q9213_006516 [Squamulea squamosa]